MHIVKYLFEGDKIMDHLYGLEQFLRQIEIDNPIADRETKQELEDYLPPAGPGGGYASLKKIEIMALGKTVVTYLNAVKGEQGVYDSLSKRLQDDLDHHLTYNQINDKGGSFLGEAARDDDSEMRIFPNLVIDLPTDGGEDNDEYFLASVRRKIRLLGGILSTLRNKLQAIMKLPTRKQILNFTKPSRNGSKTCISDLSNDLLEMIQQSVEDTPKDDDILRRMKVEERTDDRRRTMPEGIGQARKRKKGKRKKTKRKKTKKKKKKTKRIR